MAKLTLSVDAQVVSQAKRYAREHGVSVSSMVQAYLAAVTKPSVPQRAKDTPILRRLRGSLKGVDIADYRKHLEEKYL
jgi:hypothetical protein